MREHVLLREQILPGAPEGVFPFFADAANLARITPPELAFHIETPLPIALREGALLDYRLRLFGVPFSWRTRICVWQPPSAFVDEQLRGPYRLWRHTHEFEAVPDGTRMRDEVRYALPLQPLGEIALPLVRRQLERIFDYRRRVVADFFAR